MSGWVNNDPTSLTVPPDALPTDPQITLGTDIPAELLTFYNNAFREIKACLLYRLDDKAYGYDAIIVYFDGSTPYRASGIVNLDRDTAIDKVIELRVDAAGDTGAAVTVLGGDDVGSGAANARMQFSRVADFFDTAEFWSSVTMWGNLTVDGLVSILPGLLELETPRQIGTAGNPPFQNGFTNSGGGFTPARFWADAHGIVHYEGLVQINNPWVANMVICSTFGIPGYVPKSQKMFNQRTSAGATRVDVNTNGDILLPIAGGVPAAGGFISLEGIAFRTDV